MVDAIKQGSLRLSATGPSGIKELADRKVALSPSPSSVPSSATDVSELSSKVRAAALRDDPPVNIEAVTRIKDAIARGDYPINLDNIAERLMESYKQLQS